MDTRTLHIKLPTPVADAFRKACEEEGEAQGTIARRLIREWIEDRRQSGWAAK